MFDTKGTDRRHLELIAAARRQFEQAVQQGLPTVASSHAARFPGDAIPRGLPTIAGYDIRREVHRGGQGIVYEATQVSTGRSVAIKILRQGPLAAEAERIRFEREVSILAGLEHRSIVGILDRGEAAGGHYLVMEFVDGRPLDRFAREQGLSIRQRLQLFTEVCEAVSNAHLRGVIHRDLKPGNILVTEGGEPRILDFGLAKMTEEGASVEATQSGQIIGSLPWLSPEQARRDAAGVDIRSDVYSLGVILYQLLTDQFPYSTFGDLESALSNIRTTEPERPSRLNREVDDDLDTIALKCLAKEPARRYQSVSGLVRDVRYYLAGEAIEAKRDSRWYVAQLMFRRNKLAFAVAAGFVTLTTISSVALSVLYRAKAEEQARSVAAQKQAEKAAAKADAVTEFLTTMLSAADPGRDGHDVKVIDVMKRASAQVSTKFVEQPDVEIAIRLALGKTYYELGQFADAEHEMRAGHRMASERMGEDSDDAAALLGNLSMFLWVQGKLEEAEVYARKALDHQLRIHGELTPESIDMMCNMGAILNARGRPLEGAEWNRRALTAAEKALGPDHEQTYNCRNNLAFSLDKADKFAEAEPLYRQVVEHNRATGVGDSPDALVTLQSLSGLLRRMGKLDESESLARHIVEIRRRILPPGHPSLGDSAQLLGRIQFTRGDFAGSVESLREAVEIHGKSLPPDSWRTAVTRNDLGRALSKSGQFAEAEQNVLEAHRVLSATGDHPRQVAEAVQVLVDLYTAWDAAEPGTGKAEKAAEWRTKLPTTSGPSR